MKRILLLSTFTFSFILIIFSCTHIKTKKNDLQNLKLTGPVKFYRIKQYVYIKGYGEGHPFSDFGYRINKNGYTYEEIYYDYNNGTDTSSKKMIKRDADENILEGHSLYKNRPYSKEIYNYDKTKNIVEIDYYDSTSTFTGKTVLKNDAIGNNLQTKDYSKDGKLERVETNTYYTDGNNIKLWTDTGYKDDGKIYIFSSKKFDPNGNLLELVKNNLEEKYSSKWVNKYDETGKMKSDTLYNLLNGKMTSWGIYKCDDKGNIIEYTSFSADSTVQHNNPLEVFKYVYDSNGNWTNCTRIDGGTEYNRIEREIRYY